MKRERRRRRQSAINALANNWFTKIDYQFRETHTYSAIRFPLLIRNVRRGVPGGSGRSLCRGIFSAGRLETGPFHFVVNVVLWVFLYQCCGQIQSYYVLFVIISLILIHFAYDNVFSLCVLCKANGVRVCRLLHITATRFIFETLSVKSSEIKTTQSD